MKLSTITTSQEWDALVQSKPHASLLQSFAWGEFQRALGKPIYRFTTKDRNIVAQVIVEQLPLGISRWYIPRGPVGDLSHTPEFLRAIAGYAKEHYASVLHIDPLEPIAMKTDAQHATREPKATRIVDLSSSESELLQRMKPKTRYNINVAKRHGVVMDHGTSSAHLETFLTLSKETAKRQGIRLHPDHYYKTILQTFGAQSADIIVASYHNMPLAALLFLDYGDTMTYLHGASSHAHRNVMAPYAAHWFAMQNGKSRGMHYDDLWGEAPEGAIDHPFSSITRFKQGFGGDHVEYPDAIVKNLSPLRAWVYNLYRRMQG